MYGSSRIGLLHRSFDVAEEYNPTDTTMPLLGTGLSHNFGRGNKLFELSNHLGNVLVTVNDKKLGVSSNNNVVDYFNPQVVSAQDYYPFGMLQVGRVFNTSGYRYGFNGKEKDKEVKGEGNQQDYGMRIYDTRLGRFLSVDPLTKNFAFYSPYHFAGNNPIQNKDLDGKEPQDFRRNWIPKQLFNLNTKSEVGENDWTLRVTDSKIGPVDAYMVYDQWTKSVWFVAEQDGDYYYLKNDNGNPSEMTIRPDKKRGINLVSGGVFERFDTQDQLQVKYAAESSDILGTTVFGFAATGAALPFMTATGGGPLWSINPFTKVGALKAIIGAGGDFLSQITMNPNGRINVISIIANGVFANPWTAAAVASATSPDKDEHCIK